MKRLATLLAIATLSSVFGVATASAQEVQVVVMAFEGPRRARVRRQVVRALADQREIGMARFSDLVDTAKGLGYRTLADPEQYVAVARELHLAGFVEGQVSRDGRRWSAEISVRDGLDGRVLSSTVVEANNPRQLEARVRRRVWRDLEDAFLTITPPTAEEPEPEPVRTTPRARDTETPPGMIDTVAADEAGDDIDDDAAAEDGEGQEALRVVAGVDLFGRRYSYRDDIFGDLGGYRLKMGPAITANVEWFPAAHFTNNTFANVFGLRIDYAKVVGVQSQPSRQSNVTYATDSQRWEIGLLGRIPVGRAELRVDVGYGGHRYALASGEEDIGLPDVDYRYLRTGLSARVDVGSRIVVETGAAWLFLTAAGEVGSAAWFPRMVGGGLDARLGLRVHLVAGLDAVWSIGLRRYFFTLNPEPGDPHIAGGLLDQYVGSTLGLGYSF